jgi:hypothetical protein
MKVLRRYKSDTNCVCSVKAKNKRNKTLFEDISEKSYLLFEWHVANFLYNKWLVDLRMVFQRYLLKKDLSSEH